MHVSELLKEVHDGIVALPDFQRSFVWEPEDVRELLVSVLGNYFIGSMLILEEFKDDSPFALRLAEGVSQIHKGADLKSIVKILLDGQQRTSALFYAMFEPDLPLKNRKSAYKFFLDIYKALNKEWNDAVIAVNVNDRRRMSYVKDNDGLIPFSHLKDIGGLAQRFKDDNHFKQIIDLANGFMNREIHVVRMDRGTDLERIVETFERINRTGEPLSVFELLTARMYKYNIKLRDLLENARQCYNFVEHVSPEFILKVICLLRGREIKRKNILHLRPDNFEKDWEVACAALEAAFERAVDIKHGYGVLDFKRWIPYSTMLIPLAGMIYWVKAGKLESKDNYDKIERWYWTAVFSNRYDQAADTTSVSDVNDIKTWLAESGEVPGSIQEFEAESVDLDVNRQSSATYRGVINMIVLQGAIDIMSGNPPQFGREKVQDDHIFPKSIYDEHRISNRTLISTNAEKGNKRPSEYFGQCLEQLGKDKLKAILMSHIIPGDSLDYLLNDDIASFLEARERAIVEAIREKVGLSKNMKKLVKK